MWTAKFFKNICVISNQKGENVGELIYENKLDRINCIIKIGEDVFDVNKTSKFNSTIAVAKNNEKILQIQISLWNGVMSIEPGNKKIKGVSSWKGGTQLVDGTNNPLVKVNTSGVFIQKNLFEITVLQEETEDFDIVLCLYCHILASKNKAMAVVTGI